MNNKSFLTVVIAILLAILCAFLIIKRDNTKTQIENKAIKVQEEVVTQLERQREEIFEEKKVEKPELEEIIKETKQTAKSTFIQPNKKTEIKEPISEEVTIQEGSVVEEVEDFGIRKNDDGIFEITREFKMKSPTKYSFIDFGFLENITR